MTIGFTGTRAGMTGQQGAAVMRLLHELKATRLLHGACEGADRQVHELSHGILRDMYPSNREQWTWAMNHCAPGDTVLPLPASDVKPNPQIWRNHRIVDRAHVIIAAPLQATEILRSGTWATIRYAADRLVQCYRVLPDGTVVAPEGA